MPIILDVLLFMQDTLSKGRLVTASAAMRAAACLYALPSFAGCAPPRAGCTGRARSTGCVGCTGRTVFDVGVSRAETCMHACSLHATWTESTFYLRLFSPCLVLSTTEMQGSGNSTALTRRPSIIMYFLMILLQAGEPSGCGSAISWIVWICHLWCRVNSMVRVANSTGIHLKQMERV